MRRSEAIKKYGKDWQKMLDSGWLDGITLTMLPDGETDIPERDLERAYNAAKLKE